MTATIVRIAAQGEGVTDDGRFIPLTAPGDTVSDEGVVTPGPHHAVPPCRHFPACGGCQLQHVDDAAYSDFLHQRIVGALGAQGLDAPEIDAAILSPPESRRRASLRVERQGKRVVIGFNEEKTHRVVDMRMCSILHPALFALIEPLRRLLLPILRERRAGGIRMTLTDQGVDLLIEKIEIEGLAAIEALNAFCVDHKLARLSVDAGYGPETRWEPDPTTITLGDIAVGFPHAGFLQATHSGEDALTRAVLDIVGDAATVVDLFAGLGTFALPLSRKAKVLAVEGARDAALALKFAAHRAQLMMMVEHRDLFRKPLDVAELSRFDAVVLDPPRAGAKEQMRELARSDVQRIAYVSCNPATFARDASMLADGGWELQRVLPVGQFRWSTHAELVASFAR